MPDEAESSGGSGSWVGEGIRDKKKKRDYYRALLRP